MPLLSCSSRPQPPRRRRRRRNLRRSLRLGRPWQLGRPRRAGDGGGGVVPRSDERLLKLGDPSDVVRMLAFDPRLHEAAPPALPQRTPPPEARSRSTAPALASAAPALAAATPAAATPAVAGTAAAIAATATAVAAAVRPHVAAQHLRGDEGAEAVRVLCGRQRRDAVGVCGSEEGAVAEAEEQPLRLPSERVALEHVDDAEEVDALAVRRRNAALLE
mmetsp:Transcript_42184/g.136884  ORF Transcript_42184/g.136884 Transcript_42184/m.136884 type:complete len:218 (-) Transcript_42184:473-1126(-)